MRALRFGQPSTTDERAVVGVGLIYYPSTNMEQEGRIVISWPSAYRPIRSIDSYSLLQEGENKLINSVHLPSRQLWRVRRIRQSIQIDCRFIDNGIEWSNAHAQPSRREGWVERLVSENLFQLIHILANRIIRNTGQQLLSTSNGAACICRHINREHLNLIPIHLFFGIL